MNRTPVKYLRKNNPNTIIFHILAGKKYPFKSIDKSLLYNDIFVSIDDGL